MNFRIIAYIVGWVCNFQAMFMVLPCITALIYQEHEFFAFLISMIVCLIVGLPLTIRKPKNKVFYTKDGCVAVALSWFALCISGAVPFVLSGAIPHPIDAFFETVSGFTTTGIQYPDRCGSSPSLYSAMEKFHTLDRWHGGSCILALTAATCRRVSYESDESRKPWSFRQQTGSKSSADRQNSLHDLYWNDTVPDYSSSDRQNSSVRYPVYFFCTAGTGGFGIVNDSMGSYSTYCQVVTTIFMILFGVNFSAYYLLLTKKFVQAFKFEEVRYYFGIILAAILVIGLNTAHLFRNLGEAFQQAAFQVGSIITTTGFSSTDFSQWPSLSKTILVLLMFVGACAGSTGGGIKVSRILILCKAAKKEFQLYLHPNAVKKIKMDEKTIGHDIISLQTLSECISPDLSSFCPYYLSG